jgi:hypothetical protein
VNTLRSTNNQPFGYGQQPRQLFSVQPDRGAPPQRRDYTTHLGNNHLGASAGHCPLQTVVGEREADREEFGILHDG